MIRDYDLLRVGDLAVDDFGIVRVTEKDASGITVETVIPKDIFVEAYNKFIAEPLINTTEVHIKGET